MLKLVFICSHTTKMIYDQSYTHSSGNVRCLREIGYFISSWLLYCHDSLVKNILTTKGWIIPVKSKTTTVAVNFHANVFQRALMHIRCGRNHICKNCWKRIILYSCFYRDINIWQDAYGECFLCWHFLSVLSFSTTRCTTTISSVRWFSLWSSLLCLALSIC